MEITVVITKVLQPQQYQKRDGSIGVRNSFVGKTITGQYDHELKFDVNSQDAWNYMQLQIGQTVNVSFDIASRSYNSPTKGEIWFTSLNAWKAVVQTYNNQLPVNQTTQPQQAVTTQTTTNSDDIPF